MRRPVAAGIGAVALALGVGWRLGRRKRRPAEQAKAAEDRHIGFRWLAWAGRLAGERDAEAVFHAVAAALGERIGRGEARHIAAHLPLGLRQIWEEETRHAGRPQGFDRAELVARVQARLGLERAEDAETLVAVVFAWLKHLAPEEKADVGGLLPADLRQLWESASLASIPRWHRLAVSLARAV